MNQRGEMRLLCCLMAALVVVAGCDKAITPAGSAPSAAFLPSTHPSTPTVEESPDPSPLWLSAIQRVDAATGFIETVNQAGQGRLAATTDAGRTWTEIATPLRYVTAIHFGDAHKGWVTGVLDDHRWSVLHTSSGGKTWDTSTAFPAAPGAYPPVQIDAVDGDVAWVVIPTCNGCAAQLRRTLDGGRSWTTVRTAPIVLIRFLSATRGWIATTTQTGRTDVYVTLDGGDSWAASAHTSFGGVSGLEAIGSTAWLITAAGGYCTGSTCERYQLLRTTDMGASWSDLGNPKRANTPCAGGHLVGPLFVTATRGWFAENIGAGGAMASTGWMRTDDGGAKWSCSSTPSEVSLVSIADPMRLWIAVRNPAGSYSDKLMESDDGGDTWQAVNLTPQKPAKR